LNGHFEQDWRVHASSEAMALQLGKAREFGQDAAPCHLGAILVPDVMFAMKRPTSSLAIEYRQMKI